MTLIITIIINTIRIVGSVEVHINPSPTTVITCQFVLDKCRSSNHTLVISQKNTVLAKSPVIKPGETYYYRLPMEGLYNFSSPQFEWIKGNVIASDKLVSQTREGVMNPVAIKLVWFYPSTLGPTHFIIMFFDNMTNKNKEHIDYTFSIIDSKNTTIFQQSMHSGCGH